MPDMITYQEAAALLGVQYNTIKIAVHNGRLTRCSTGTRHALLLKEQVELFLNKHGISENYLTSDEKERWEQYKKLAENPPQNGSSEVSIMSETIANLVSNQSKLSDELTKMQNAYSTMRECMNKIQNLLSETDINIPEEMNGPFPPLTLLRENA